MSTTSAIATGVDAMGTLHRALQEIGEHTRPDLLLVFASSRFADDFGAIVREAKRWTDARLLAGCSGQAIVGMDREIEGEAAISLLALEAPGAWLHATHLPAAAIAELEAPSALHDAIGVPADDPRGWLVFADPFTADIDALVRGIESSYPGATVAGGLASGDFEARRTHLFFDDQVFADGAVLVGIGGDYTLRAVVSQGAEPIGETWTVTSAHANHIETIGNRPAYQVLVDTVRSLGPEQRERARTNLLVGLAIDERREIFRRGDFLIRNLIGADPESGSLAVGAMPRVGQTIQFQIRDADAADDELKMLLDRETGVAAEAAVICTCNGRGRGLFGVPDHDAGLVARRLGAPPAAGFFCNGEIGQVGGRTFVHGFTATVGVIVREPRT